jgi:hypothetical protein
LTALLQEAWRACPAGPPVPMLFDRQVPHISGMRAVVSQNCLLSGRRKQPISGHTNTLAITADISGEVKRRVLSGLEAGVSTSRS